MSYDRSDKVALAAKFKIELDALEKLRKDGAPLKLDGVDADTLLWGRLTYESLQMDFANLRDLPLVWPDYLERYAKLCELRHRLKA